MSSSSHKVRSVTSTPKPFLISLLRAKAKGSSDWEACMVLKEFKSGLVRVFLQVPPDREETLFIEVIIRPCEGGKAPMVSGLEERIQLAKKLDRLGFTLTEEGGYLEAEKIISPTILESEMSNVFSAIASLCDE